MAQQDCMYNQFNMPETDRKEWIDDYVDLHCHPAMKPFGKSYNYKPKFINHPYKSRRNSIWKYDPPSLGDKLVNYLTGITKFSQSNFTSISKGGLNVVCASLYPIEKWFFVNKIDNEFIRDIAANFATGIGKKRVDAIQRITNYFQDVEREYKFYRKLDGKVIRLPEGKFRYRLVSNYQDIETIKNADPDDITTICVVMTIEGLHVLNNDIRKPPNAASFMANLNTIKNWDHPPFFVTIAHHFWNHLCGHEESFSGIVKKKVDQSEGLGKGFTALGKNVVNELLDTNGRRILIDIKHMSVKSRYEYYDMIDDTIPIIVSHGAANGQVSPDDTSQGGSQVANKLSAVKINFYNDEIIKIARSKGILGLQLDERRIASEQTLKDTKSSLRRSKIMHYRSELLWFQIQHILEVLDAEDMFAWDCIALGTDFDGIIDPLNAFWTQEELPFLADFLERHVYNYMSNASFKHAKNNIETDEVIARVMSQNALRFMKAHF